MTNRQRQHVLINGSNLHVGGGVAVATSYIKSLSQKKNLEFDISLLVSTKIMKNLKDLDTDFSVFRSVKSIDYVGIKALWSGLSKELSGYDLVFTVFGPAYTLRKPTRHIVGFAQPSIIYPDSRAFLKIPVRQRKVERLRFKLQEFFFAQADALVVELEHVKTGLQKIPAFRNKKIYVVNSAVDSVFSEPDRWLAIDTPMGSDRRIKLGLISRNYAHKNLDLLPYIKQTLKEKHAIEADLFVTFVPEEWDTCSDFFKENINNVGPLTLAQCPTFYASLDGVIFPSLLECFSAVPIESMLIGKPLFASDLPFIRDCCKTYANYFTPEDADSAAAVIADYYSRPLAEQESFASDAQRFVSSYPSAADRADSYLTLIRRELNG
ncbi:glycosyltransferase [Pseudomonas fragi]|uniref:glycosyltransferase n=1 Tax=Pseudomonas fragi TaxID=296 RepID=UPI0030A1CE89